MSNIQFNLVILQLMLVQIVTAARHCHLCHANNPSTSICSPIKRCSINGTNSSIWCLTVFRSDRVYHRGCSISNPLGATENCYQEGKNGDRWCYCADDMCNNHQLMIQQISATSTDSLLSIWMIVICLIIHRYNLIMAI